MTEQSQHLRPTRPREIAELDLNSEEGDLTLETSVTREEILSEQISEFSSDFSRAAEQIGKEIVGLESQIRTVLAVIYAGGNALMEGNPGLGKTRLVKAIGKTLNLEMGRIQFTADLLPGDITGSLMPQIDSEGRQVFAIERGPVFTNLLLADEVNRAHPKTQSALLQAMEEQQVTIGKETLPLTEPFFVLATKNPIEQEGTFPLPEAQLDRFLVKLEVNNPTAEEIVLIGRKNTGTENTLSGPIYASAEEAAEKILSARELIRTVNISEDLELRLAKTITALDPTSTNSSERVKDFIKVGPSPRAFIAAVLLAKSFALTAERSTVTRDDIQEALIPTVRHRLILKSNAHLETFTAKDLIDEAVEQNL